MTETTTMYVLMRSQHNWDDPDVCYPIGVFEALDDAKEAAERLQRMIHWRDPIAADGETFAAIGVGHYAGEFNFPIFAFEVGEVKDDS